MQKYTDLVISLFLLSFLKQAFVEVGYILCTCLVCAHTLLDPPQLTFCSHCCSKIDFSALTNDAAQCKEYFTFFFLGPSRIFDIEYPLPELFSLFLRCYFLLVLFRLFLFLGVLHIFSFFFCMPLKANLYPGFCLWFSSS